MPFGVASAVVYGTSIVVQHRTAQEQADEGPSAAGLLRLVRSPVWLLAIGGDVVGFVLQIVALSTGPVVFIQPLVVLMLPVSLGVSYLLGARRPHFGDYLGVLGVLGGLAVFLALIGHPGATHVPHLRVFVMAVLLVLAVGVVLCLVAARRNRIIRASMYGAVAGAYFGTLAVLVDAASERVARRGLHALLASPRGIVLLAGIVLLGAGGIVLTQLSFQIGALGATLPANLAADPLMAVFLGAALLREHVPLSTGHLIAYALCLAAVIAGAIQLANPAAGPIEAGQQQ